MHQESPVDNIRVLSEPAKLLASLDDAGFRGLSRAFIFKAEFADIATAVCWILFCERRFLRPVSRTVLIQTTNDVTNSVAGIRPESCRVWQITWSC